MLEFFLSQLIYELEVLSGQKLRSLQTKKDFQNPKLDWKLDGEDEALPSPGEPYLSGKHAMIASSSFDSSTMLNTIYVILITCIDFMTIKICFS